MRDPFHRVRTLWREEPPPISPALTEHLDGPIVLVDVGAHRGSFLAALSSHCEVSRAVLVEPIPECAAELRATENPRVTVVEGAAAATEAVAVKFSIGEYAEISSLLRLKSDLPELAGVPTRTAREIDVRTLTLDRVYRENALNSVDLLKIDVQGAEHLVLAGAREALRSTRMVWIETSWKPLYEGSAVFHEIYELLTHAGFELRELSPGHRAPSGELLQVDCLFVNAKHPARPRARARSLRRLGWSAFARAARLARKVRNAPAPVQARETFSQSGEDAIVRYVFSLRGVERPSYIDVGAHHPWDLSNTALFYRQGSRGINVEPNRELLAAFERERPEDINLCAAVGTGDSIDLFVFEDPALSTCSPEEARLLEAAGHRRLRTENVPVRGLVEIVERHAQGRFPDLLNVDVEGLEHAVLAPLSDRADLPKVMVIETAEYSPIGAGRKRQELIDWVLARGYLTYADTSLNTIFVRRNFWQR